MKQSSSTGSKQQLRQTQATANDRSATSEAQNFVDNRPQTIVQRQLQGIANNSVQSKQLKAFQHMAQNSARSMQLKSMSAMMNASFVQRMQEENPLQAKLIGETAQRESADQAPKPNNTGLPDHLKSGIETLSGMNMDHVKVHYNSAQPAQLNAHAYAQGSEIHVAPGQEQHVPHEAWHVVQQAQDRVKPSMQMKAGVAVNDDVGLETEADVMGAMALGAGEAAQRKLISFLDKQVQASPTAMLQESHNTPHQAKSTQRHSKKVLQRVSIDNVDWTVAASAVRSAEGGTSGVYFVTFADGRLVVKLDNNPLDSVENNEFLIAMGMNAPQSRALVKNEGDGAAIHTCLEELLQDGALEEYRRNYAKSSHFVIMSLIAGNSLRSIGGVKLQEAMAKPEVQISFGKQLIADAFLGIGDRLLKNRNPGNLMVDDNGVVYSIDNEEHADHPAPDRMDEIRTLLNWNGDKILDHILHFAIIAARVNRADPNAVSAIFKTRDARANVKTGIRQGFNDLVAAARRVGINNHLHNISGEVIALATQRANAWRCYLTTACVQSMGLADDCLQLTVLRHFRDHYMASLPEGKRLISFYYETAPRIVAKIEQQADRKQIYRSIFDCINDCVKLIQEANPEQALHLYCDLTLNLAQRFIFNTQEQNDGRTN